MHPEYREISGIAVALKNRILILAQLIMYSHKLKIILVYTGLSRVIVSMNFSLMTKVFVSHWRLASDIFSELYSVTD